MLVLWPTRLVEKAVQTSSSSIKNWLSINPMQTLFSKINQIHVHTRILSIFHQNAFADNRREGNKPTPIRNLKLENSIIWKTLKIEPV